MLVLVPDVALGGMTTPAGAELADRLLKHGEIVNIANAGHNVRREQYEAYMAAVRDFLKRQA